MTVRVVPVTIIATAACFESIGGLVFALRQPDFWSSFWTMVAVAFVFLLLFLLMAAAAKLSEE